MKSRFLPLFFFFCVCVIFVVKWWESYLVDERMAGRFTGKKVSRSNDSVTEKSLQGKMCRGEKIALLSRPMSMVSVMWCVRSLPFFFTFCQVQFFEWRRRRKKRGGGAKREKERRKSLPVWGASWKTCSLRSWCRSSQKVIARPTLLDELGDGLSSGREFLFSIFFLFVAGEVTAGECVTVSLSSFYLFLSPSCCVKFESL